MMAPSLKMVLVLLASLQFTQQASLSSGFYGSKNVLGVDSKVTFRSNFNTPSVNSKGIVEYEPMKGEELKGLHTARSSSFDIRTKRQVNQDIDIDAEIISNDQEMLSSGKSAPLTTDDDDAHKSQLEEHDNSSWNIGDETVKSNSLGVLEVNPNKANETSNEEERILDTSDSKTQASSFHTKSLAISVPNDASETRTSIEENSDDGSLQKQQQSDPEIHIVPTMNYEVPVSKESESEHSKKLASLEASAMSDDYTHNNGYKKSNGESPTAEEKDNHGYLEDTVEINEMKHDEVNMKGNDEQLNQSIDKNEAEFNEYLDKSDILEFTPFQSKNSDNSASLSQLRLPDNDTDDIEEGSGDKEGDITGSREPQEVHINKDSSTNNSIFEETSPKTNNMDINIDFDSTTDNTIREEDKGNEDESPIPDPTLTTSNVQDSAKAVILDAEGKDGEDDEGLPILEPTEKSSHVDRSKTYDPETIVNPFNIDNPLEHYLAKALGMIDHVEETSEKKDLEGSGQIEDTDFDVDSIDDGDIMSTDVPLVLTKDGGDYGVTTTHKDDDIEETEVTEVPLIAKHNVMQFNPTQTVSNENDTVMQGPITTERAREVTTEPGVMVENESISVSVSPRLSDALKDPESHVPDISSSHDNDDVVPVNTGINEMGIKNAKSTEGGDRTESTSSSSTGSFIVLGAIMAIIVLLLGYSVIKSHREKQRNSRTPPEDEQGTELKEIETLLSEKNGHGPANGLNIEAGRLLNVSEENNKNDLKVGETYNKYPNVNEGNGVRNQLNTIPKIEDPYSLSEVNVNTSNSIAPANESKQVANGISSKSLTPGHNQLSEPSSQSTDDKASLVHGTRPESAKTKMFIDHDSIPKTPIVIVKRGSNNVEM